MSIQTRLTLSFTCLFGIIVVGLAIGSDILVRNNLYSDLKTELQVAVDEEIARTPQRLKHDNRIGHLIRFRTESFSRERC